MCMVHSLWCTLCACPAGTPNSTDNTRVHTAAEYRVVVCDSHIVQSATLGRFVPASAPCCTRSLYSWLVRCVCVLRQYHLALQRGARAHIVRRERHVWKYNTESIHAAVARGKAQHCAWRSGTRSLSQAAVHPSLYVRPHCALRE
jgi:hypothetical protein